MHSQCIHSPKGRHWRDRDQEWKWSRKSKATHTGRLTTWTDCLGIRGHLWTRTRSLGLQGRKNCYTIRPRRRMCQFKPQGSTEPPSMLLIHLRCQKLSTEAITRSMTRTGSHISKLKWWNRTCQLKICMASRWSSNTNRFNNICKESTNKIKDKSLRWKTISSEARRMPCRRSTMLGRLRRGTSLQLQATQATEANVRAVGRLPKLLWLWILQGGRAKSLVDLTPKMHPGMIRLFKRIYLTIRHLSWNKFKHQ